MPSVPTTKSFGYRSVLAWVVVAMSGFLPIALTPVPFFIYQKDKSLLGFLITEAILIFGTSPFWIKIPRIVGRYRFERITLDSKSLYYTDHRNNPRIEIPRDSWRAFEATGHSGGGAELYQLIAAGCQIPVWEDISHFKELREQIKHQLSINAGEIRKNAST